MPHMTLPHFKKGDNWEDFLVEFYDMADIVGLDSYQLLPYHTMPGEKLCTLASRIEVVVNEYLPWLSSHITEEERENLIGTRFCHAIA